jgi:hypothetical protein
VPPEDDEEDEAPRGHGYRQVVARVPARRAIVPHAVIELSPAAVEQIRATFSEYVDSRPPPAMPVRERVEARIREGRSFATDTGRFEVEELQREVKSMVERAAAEKLAQEEAKNKELQKQLDEVKARQAETAKERRGMRWDLVLAAVSAGLGALAGHYVK